MGLRPEGSKAAGLKMFNNWDQPEGRGGGSRSGRGGVGVQNGLSRQDLEQLKKTTEVGTRQLKKLRKYELEQVRVCAVLWCCVCMWYSTVPLTRNSCVG